MASGSSALTPRKITSWPEELTSLFPEMLIVLSCAETVAGVANAHTPMQARRTGTNVSRMRRNDIPHPLTWSREYRQRTLVAGPRRGSGRQDDCVEVNTILERRPEVRQERLARARRRRSRGVVP